MHAAEGRWHNHQIHMYTVPPLHRRTAGRVQLTDSCRQQQRLPCSLSSISVLCNTAVSLTHCPFVGILCLSVIHGLYRAYLSTMRRCIASFCWCQCAFICINCHNQPSKLAFTFHILRKSACMRVGRRFNINCSNNAASYSRDLSCFENIHYLRPVSYTHLTLPTNREV